MKEQTLQDELDAVILDLREVEREMYEAELVVQDRKRRKRQLVIQEHGLRMGLRRSV